MEHMLSQMIVTVSRSPVYSYALAVLSNDYWLSEYKRISLGIRMATVEVRSKLGWKMIGCDYILNFDTTETSPSG